MEQRVQTVSLVVLATFATGAALYWLRPVMIPFVLALLITLGLQPLIAFQTRHLRVPRGLAVASTLLVGIGLLVLAGSVISSTVTQLSEGAPVYAAWLQKAVEQVADALPERIGDVSPRDELREMLAAPLRSLGTIAVATTNAILDLLSRSLLVLLFVAFLLAGSRGRRAMGVWGEVETSVQRFIALKTLVSAVTGLLVSLVLTILGVPLAQVFGLLAFLLNFVPSLGSIVATLLPIPVVIASADISFATAVAAIAIPGAIQLTIGNVIEPRMMGASLDLHPAAVLLALILWGALWGIVGMLLATPITASLRIVLHHFEGTRPLSDLLAGRLDAWRAPVELR